MNIRDEALARQHSNTGSLQVVGIVGFTLGLGMFVLGASDIAVIVFLVLSAGLVSFDRARARGWTVDRLSVTAAVLFGALLLEFVGWAVASFVGVLIVGFGALLAWHLGVSRRVRKL